MAEILQVIIVLRVYAAYIRIYEIFLYKVQPYFVATGFSGDFFFFFNITVLLSVPLNSLTTFFLCANNVNAKSAKMSIAPAVASGEFDDATEKPS